MNDPMRDSVDEAVDRVARQLVSVSEEPDAVDRLIASLPERRSRGVGWTSLAFPAIAVAAATVLIIVVRSPETVGPRQTTDRTASPVERAEQPASIPTLTEAAEEPQRAQRGQRALSSKPAAVSHASDEPQLFELAAIRAPEQLTIESLMSIAPLEPVELGLVQPISLGELPLAGDPLAAITKE